MAEPPGGPAGAVHRLPGGQPFAMEIRSGARVQVLHGQPGDPVQVIFSTDRRDWPRPDDGGSLSLILPADVAQRLFVGPVGETDNEQEPDRPGDGDRRPAQRKDTMPACEPVGPMVRIRALRHAYGLTAAQLADRMAELGVPVDRNSLYNIESGAKKPSDRILDAYARALGVHPLDVWQGLPRPATTEPDRVTAPTDGTTEQG
ncbi:MAG TPA: helix-turn-helix transcriptional regulator [Pseudonocardiaceae bacterium]|jgi:DNA-binding XRE family transcriptional regulator|nr:helix-turn-helix transcriptional regulator [Pseudonocardiaceae bacterium]